MHSRIPHDMDSQPAWLHSMKSCLKNFLKQERGAVLLEYVLLLMGCFLTIYVTIDPLKNAFLTFLTGIYQSLTIP